MQEGEGRPSASPTAYKVIPVESAMGWRPSCVSASYLKLFGLHDRCSAAKVTKNNLRLPNDRIWSETGSRVNETSGMRNAASLREMIGEFDD